jgi:hypothetical protein
MSDDPAYRNYWRRKQLLAGPLPPFPVRRWWSDPGLSDIERTYFEAIADRDSLLDVGAGDLRVMHKFQQAGFRGEYHTQDIGTEYPYTYRDLAAVQRRYAVVLCLDVLEHLTLRDGLNLLDRMVELLEPGGVLILQTPNARCLSDPFSWDMTHVQCYNITDLWAYLTSLGLSVQPFRVRFAPARRPPLEAVRALVSDFLITRLLSQDYAENLAFLARKPAD